MLICLLDLQVLFFGGGWVFFLKQLFRDYEVRSFLFTTQDEMVAV